MEEMDAAYSADPDQAALLESMVENLDLGFVGLVRREQRVVYSVAFRMTGHRADAEDLAAETFLRAYQALLRFDKARVLSLRPRAWLLTIELNLWRNSVRDAKRRPKIVAADELPEQESDAVGIEQLVITAESNRELGALLGQLPQAQKVAVTLRHVVGLPLIEVAEVMGCPEGTAKSHVSRGLTRLRKLADVTETPLRSLDLAAGRESR